MQACSIRESQLHISLSSCSISLLSWNRIDGRTLLDFIRDSSPRPFGIQEKTDEELDEFVNFERYRDLIKHGVGNVGSF